MSGGKNKVLLGIGSNISPKKNIPAAVKLLTKTLSVTAMSSFFFSKPVGYLEQEDFVNGCITVGTELLPRELKFGVLRELEKRLGRCRTENKNGPRTIDLDILLFENIILQEPDITVPDPDLFTQNYLLIPAQEIAGDMVNPLNGKKVEEYTGSASELILSSIFQ